MKPNQTNSKQPTPPPPFAFPLPSIPLSKQTSIAPPVCAPPPQHGPVPSEQRGRPGVRMGSLGACMGPLGERVGSLGGARGGSGRAPSRPRGAERPRPVTARPSPVSAGSPLPVQPPGSPHPYSLGPRSPELLRLPISFFLPPLEPIAAAAAASTALPGDLDPRR